jgi:hypothetical protein
MASELPDVAGPAHRGTSRKVQTCRRMVLRLGEIKRFWKAALGGGIRFAAAFFAIAFRSSGDSDLAPPCTGMAAAGPSRFCLGNFLELPRRDPADHDGVADHVGGRFSPLGPRGISRFRRFRFCFP